MKLAELPLAHVTFQSCQASIMRLVKPALSHLLVALRTHFLKEKASISPTAWHGSQSQEGLC